MAAALMMADFDRRFNNSRRIPCWQRRKRFRFAVGHMALGYILGKGSARLVKTDLNIPLALMLSVIPDMDILAEHIDGLASVIPHRGPVHSVLVALVVFIPIFIICRKAALPYFMALIQHALIGDYFSGGQLELFWPITQQKFGFPTDIKSIQNVGLELSLFAVSIILLLATKDLHKMFQPHKSNLILAIPTFTVLLPTLTNYPLDVPILMIPPHVIYMIIFAVSIMIEMWAVLRSVRKGRFGRRKKKANVDQAGGGGLVPNTSVRSS
jgi:membrane-bound metal-dependent hydrolase YbcI (DUF457 family)